jgi:glucose-6-phosphate isomerase
MCDCPFTFDIVLPGGIPTRYDHHIVRTLSAMKRQYADPQSYLALLAAGDVVVYEVYETHRSDVAGELLHGVSLVHPGKVGDEYFMTKGHFHARLEAAEVYYCLQGSGMIVLETPAGEWAVQSLRPGTVLYVPPRWAHRSVNVGRGEDLVTFFVYPAGAGHDYATLERRGFRKLVVERAGQPHVTDNPHWRPEENWTRMNADEHG